MMQYLDRFYFYLSRHSLRDWLYTLFTGICIFFCMELSLGLSMQQELAEYVIRFHVTAAGNSEEEQALKRHVYDRVFEKLQVFLEGVSSPQEAGERIHENLALVTEWAKEAVKNVGAQEEVQASFGVETFPTRISRGTTLPAGDYATLRIQLGQGEGHNWWCLLFPDPEKGRLSEEETWIVAEEQTEEVKMRFWLLEMWQSWMEEWFGGDS